MIYNKLYELFDVTSDKTKKFEIRNNGSEKESFPPKRKDDNDDFITENKIISVTNSVMIIQSVNNKNYKCYVLDIVGDIKNYEGMLNLFKILKEDAVVDVFISSYGGSVETGLLICSSMLECKATINTHVLDIACSMGGLIWAFGDNLNLFPGAIVMFHNIAGFFYGQLGSVKKKLEHTNSIGEGFFDYCIEKKILLKEEADLILSNDEEFYVPYDEMIKRIGKGEKS